MAFWGHRLKTRSGVEPAARISRDVKLTGSLVETKCNACMDLERSPHLIHSLKDLASKCILWKNLTRKYNSYKIFAFLVKFLQGILLLARSCKILSKENALFYKILKDPCEILVRTHFFSTRYASTSSRHETCNTAKCYDEVKLKTRLFVSKI